MSATVCQTVRILNCLALLSSLLLYSMTGITLPENSQFTFNIATSSGWLSWSPPLFSSENTPISYHIYIVNQHGQLLYNDITEDTSYVLYNLTVCDIYTATVRAYSGGYSSSNVTIQEEFSGGMLIVCLFTHYLFIIECYITVSPDHKVIFNEHNSCNVQFRVTVSKH